MSELKGLEISDIFGFSKPLEKLIETVSCGVGKLYEPMYIKRMAKAKAEEIKIISSTVTENIDLPISYQNGDIGIDITDANGLVNRAQNRFLFQEMKKQQNIESVVSYAYTILENNAEVDEKPVDEDWISSFFDCVANISNDQMQKIWGRLLAGEVAHPGNFSIRTIDILRKLTQKEAALFTKYVPLILRCAGDESCTFYDYFLFRDTSGESIITRKYGYSFPEIVLLIEAGLISPNDQVSVGLHTKSGGCMFFEGQYHAIEIQNNNDHEVFIAHEAYILTESGKELFNIIAETNLEAAPYEYFEDCAKLVSENKWLIPDDERKRLVWRIIKI